MLNQKGSRTPWLQSVVITVLVCLIAVLAAFWLTPRKNRQISEYIALPAYSQQQCAAVGNGAAYYDGTMLYVLGENGMQKWNFFAGANAGFDVGEGGIASWSGKQITLLNSENGTTVFSLSLTKNVLSAYAGSQYVAVSVGEEDDALMVVLDMSGREVDSIAMPNETILDFGFFNNGNLFWVMSLNTDSTVPVSRLSTYKPGKTQTGSITDSDQIVYRVLFQSTQICAVGTTYARSYSYTGKEDSSARLLVYGWYMEDVGPEAENPLMVFVPMEDTGGEAQLQDIRLVRGGKERILRLPTPCYRVLAGKNGTIYGFTREYCVVANMDSTECTVYQLPIYADNVLGLTDDMKALVVSGGQIAMVPLPTGK